MSNYGFEQQRQAERARWANSDPTNPRGVALHPETGLPEYPRGTHATETRLSHIGGEVTTVADDLRTTLDELADTFGDAFEVEDRRAETRARIQHMTQRQQRI